MKTIALLVFSLTSVSVSSQVLYIKEIPDVNLSIMKGINKERNSLGLKPLKESAEMDSAAKHHAYYIAYDLMFREDPDHDEIDDIPNFVEKKEIEERGAKGEILAYSSLGITERESRNKTYEEIEQDQTSQWSFYFDGEDQPTSIITSYKESAPHYKIIKHNIGEGYYGSFSLLVIMKTPFHPIPYFRLINVIDFK